MVRELQLKIGGVNIRVHSKHEPSEYVDLWNMLHRLKRPRTRGNAAIMIGDVRKVDSSDPLSALKGYFYRFIDINPDDPWFNIDEHKKAEAEDVAEVKIPKKLKPNLKEVPYIFDVKKHRLYFQTAGKAGAVTPGLVKGLLEQLSMHPRISERFGEMDITTLARKGTLDSLLKWPEIRKITVVLKRPNPSDFDDEKAFFDRLNRRHLKREEHIFVKQSGAKSITPDAAMERMFKVAVDNGVYTQTGVNPLGEVKTASSQSYPLQQIVRYDPERETANEAFENFVMQQNN